MSPREREAVWWCTAFRKALQQYRKLPEPWDLKLPALPAGPWLGCASTRPRHSGRRTGRPPSPGSLPRWSSRCRCGSSPAGPREQHSGRLLGTHGSRPCRGSDRVAESGTKYWRGYLVLTRWDRLRAAYLHRLECGREGILQGAAGQPPHLLREHRARCHEDVPAGRNSLAFRHFIVTKGRPCPVSAWM